MIRLLIWLLLIYIGYRAILALAGGGKKENGGSGASAACDAETTHCDPICGVYVSEEDAVIGTLDGHRHYFCSMNCLEKFREQLDHTPS
jgi:YHS domain-containing protein